MNRNHLGLIIILDDTDIILEVRTNSNEKKVKGISISVYEILDLS